MQKRITRNVFMLSVVTILLTAALLLWGVYSLIEKSSVVDMRNETLTIAGEINFNGNYDYIKSSFFQDVMFRVTVIEQNGDVLFDNKAQNLKNHKNRPEVISAIKTGEGSDIRYSGTLEKTTYYYACKLNDGNILRLANTKNNVIGIFLQIIPVLIAILVLVSIVSFFLIKITMKRLMKPVKKIMQNLTEDKGIELQPYEEFLPFVNTVNSQRMEIKAQIDTLIKDRDTISTITENMSEGMILLDESEKIIAMNAGAKRILDVKSEEFLGKNIIAATRNAIVNEAAALAIQGKFEAVTLEQNGKYYQVHGCNAENQGKNIGTVLFLVDITHEQFAQKMRKEFTANVSHELKTPLTSISGYAEMMKNNLVATEDMPKFSSKIFNECQRMIVLIGDILTLSKLDELSDDIIFEEVDVFEIAAQMADSLKEEASKTGVKIVLSGEPLSIVTSESMVSQMVYNLIENAVKYNKAGGKVYVNVLKERNGVTIEIRDTGIGIPEEEKERIFERFYRVDKSRSKNIEGTGLGLSIVKHILNATGGDIKLESKIGEGTSIKVFLKK